MDTQVSTVDTTFMDSDWKTLKAEAALLMITSGHESLHCFTQVSVAPNAEPSALSSWTPSTLSLCSCHATLHQTPQYRDFTFRHKRSPKILPASSDLCLKLKWIEVWVKRWVEEIPPHSLLCKTL